MGVKCLAQEQNVVPRPGLEPGPFNPESSALTIRPPCLPIKSKDGILIKNCWLCECSQIYQMHVANLACYFAYFCQVLKLIQQKQSQVLFVITGDCGNQTISASSTAYELISTASSGQVFHLKKKDVNQVLKFVEESVQANRVNLISTDTGHTANKTYIVPVDNALLELTIALSGEHSALDLYHPDGNLWFPIFNFELHQHVNFII